jgi:uncharacterized protein (DUF1697 family)
VTPAASPKGPPVIPSTFVALLRGVNVGGKNLLPMKRLVELFEAAGAGDVRTYIQSGNVVFTATAAKATRIAAGVTMRVREELGFHVPILLRSARELDAVARDNPFLRNAADPATLHVLFLPEPPAPAAVAALDRGRSPPDAFEARGSEIYLRLPNGMGRTKLGVDYFDRALATRCTARNWRTVLALLELASGEPPPYGASNRTVKRSQVATGSVPRRAGSNRK